jgi:multiple sugar transport system permease protein
MVYPLLWLVSSSLKSNTDVFKDAHNLIPKELHFENYIIGWQGFGGYSFSLFFKNTLFYTFFATLGAVASSAVIAYAFSRIKFPGRKFWFSTVILTLLLPGQVLMIPRFIMFYNLGWFGSFKPLIVGNYFGHAFFIFLIMQFIMGIPKEMDEAAKIDGCNRYSIFWYIILPLIKPALVTCTIFQFYWVWDDFLGPQLYLNRPTKYTMALAIKAFADPSGQTNWTAMFAMSTLSLMPIIIVFFLTQRYITGGISVTGLKG